jgi:hypothetical protein
MVLDSKELEFTDRHIPFKAEELYSWNIGDNVFYESTGGVVFGASAGIPQVTVGTAIAHQGAWRFYVEKTDDEKVYVNATKANINSSAAFAGNIILNISKENLKDLGNGFSFEIDLSDSDAARAYEDMLRGNMIPIQRMSDDEMNTSVKKISANRNLTTGKKKTFMLGIPFANFVTSKGSYYKLDNVEYFANGIKTESEYGIYSKEVKTRFLNSHKNKIKAFYGGTLKATDNTGKLVSLEDKVSFNWFFENDYGSGGNLNKALKDFLHDTGLNQLNIKAPDIKNLGYVSISLKAESGTTFTKALIGRNQLANVKNIAARTEKLIINYFAEGDKNEICNTEEIFENCQSRITSESKNAMKNVRSLVVDLKSQYGNNPKLFTQTYAKIGEQIWTNQFTFKAFLEQMKNCGNRVSYEVAGERVSNYQIQENSEMNEKSCK